MHELTGELLKRFHYAQLTRPLHWGSGLAMQDYGYRVLYSRVINVSAGGVSMVSLEV